MVCGVEDGNCKGRQRLTPVPSRAWCGWSTRGRPSLDWAALMPGQGGQQGGGSMSKQPTEQTWSIYRIKGTLAVLLG